MTIPENNIVFPPNDIGDEILAPISIKGISTEYLILRLNQIAEELRKGLRE